MRKVVIVGTGNLGELMLYHLKKSKDYEVVAFTGEEGKIPQSHEYLGLPVASFEVVEQQYPPEEYDVLITVGHTDMNRNRERLFIECKAKGYSIITYIHPTAYVSDGVEIGEGNIILEFAFVGPFAKIGDCNIIWNHVKIAHGVEVGDFNSFSGSARMSGNATIGDNCFLGADAAVVDRIHIANYTFMGASALATHDTKPYEIIVPAQSESITRIKSTDFVKISHT